MKTWPRQLKFVTVALLLFRSSGAFAQATDALKSGFENPPSSARPQVWWHWIDGNIDLDGAKLDLAWMNRVGVGGIHTFSGGGFGEPLVVKTRVPFMSAEWQNVFRQTTDIARSMGMEVTIAGSPGWSETGGTWVIPEHAMKKYVWSETQVEGGSPFNGELTKPPSTTGPFLGVKAARKPPSNLTHDVYVDAAVVAFPSSADDIAAANVSYSSSTGPLDLSPLRAGDLANTVSLPIKDGETSAWVQAAFDHPTLVSSLILAIKDRAAVEVMASDDGQSFRTLCHADAETAETPSPEQTYTFEPTRARIFRIVLTAAKPAPPFPGLPKAFIRPPQPLKEFELLRLMFTGSSRVDRFESKAGFTADMGQPDSKHIIATNGALKQQDVIDLSAYFKDGRLIWTPPPGRWTVLRLGYSLTGQTNGPAEAAATGLEVDKLDAEMVRNYADQYLTLYAKACGKALGSASIQNLLTDSWEAGTQNWTPAMQSQFKRRRGYDMLPFLPVLAGHVVGSTEISDRFLWDFRTTLKELLAENHYGVLAKVMHEHGMGYYTEAQGDTPRAIGDGFAIKARADIPTAEFWYRPFATAPGQPSLVADLEEASSVAHIYGKQFAAAESLTVAAGNDPWDFSPRMLKPVADEIFAHGINRILMHESHHQPLIDAKPGLEMLIFGQYFNRNDTWAEEAGPWVSYLARTSYLLQQGHAVADVLYFYGEEKNLTEIYKTSFNTDVPEGYHYDYINAEALRQLVSVKDGRLVTASGMSYRVLFVPPSVTHLSLSSIEKIRNLAADGAVIVCPKPQGTLGLPDSDDVVKKIADQVWGSGAISPSGHAFGKGHVYAGGDLAHALVEEKVEPDIAFQGKEPDARILTLHRTLPAEEIYFVSNQLPRSESLEMTFRVAGMAPELWHADTGATEQVSYRMTEQGVAVPLTLAADEAAFVVFRKSATKKPDDLRIQQRLR